MPPTPHSSKQNSEHRKMELSVELFSLFQCQRSAFHTLSLPMFPLFLDQSLFLRPLSGVSSALVGLYTHIEQCIWGGLIQHLSICLIILLFLINYYESTCFVLFILSMWSHIKYSLPVNGKTKTHAPPQDVWVKVPVVQNEFIDFFSSVCVLGADWTEWKWTCDMWGRRTAI